MRCEEWERDCVKIEKIVKLGLNAGGALGVYIHGSSDSAQREYNAQRHLF